jgi:hypothetical protein
LSCSKLFLASHCIGISLIFFCRYFLAEPSYYVFPSSSS